MKKLCLTIGLTLASLGLFAQKTEDALKQEITTKKESIAALEGDMSESLKMRETYKERRDLVLEKLNEIPGIGTYTPTGAFYIFPDVSSYFGKSFEGEKISNASDLAMYLLNDAYVATVTGSAFGAPNCIRISFAASNEELIEAMSRIKKSLSKLA